MNKFYSGMELISACTAASQLYGGFEAKWVKQPVINIFAQQIRGLSIKLLSWLYDGNGGLSYGK